MPGVLTKFFSSTPTEVIWTFDAALCMWACLHFCSHCCPSYSDSSISNVPRYVLDWIPPPFLEEWIESGDGYLSIQGLESGMHVTVQAVLRGATERLDVMSWGLAARYREVLNTL